MYRTESLQHTEWTNHHIVYNRTRFIEIPAGMKKIRVKITRKTKYESKVL